MKKMLKFDDKNFEIEVLQSRIPVLVDFWAPWCGPCQAAGPVIESLEEENRVAGRIKFGKLNIDENPKIAEKYGIMSIPTVIVFKDRKEVKRQVGFEGKEKYAKLVEDSLK